jgi:hypothetical protein
MIAAINKQSTDRFISFAAPRRALGQIAEYR